MSALDDATNLLERLVDENPEMPARELKKHFDAQLTEPMRRAIVMSVVKEMMKEER